METLIDTGKSQLNRYNCKDINIEDCVLEIKDSLIENDVIIGDNVTIKSGVQLWDGIRIGNNCFVGPNSTFINNPYPRSKKYCAHIGAKLGNNVSIGASSTIMGNITIQDYAMIGAASLVTKNVGKNELWYVSWITNLCSRSKYFYLL